MEPFDDDDKKKKNPFDDFTFDEDFFNEILENLFNSIMENENVKEEIRRIAEEIMKNPSDFQTERPFIHGFKIGIDPDGKPHIEKIETDETNQYLEDEGYIEQQDLSENNPEVIEGDEEISVTLEIPGVKKKDIDLKVSKNLIKIKVNHPENQFYKELKLPCVVKPRTTKATYKNGILDIIIKKRDKRKINNGFHINID